VAGQHAEADGPYVLLPVGQFLDIREVVSHRIIETDDAALDQLHHQHGRERLRDRPRAADGLFITGDDVLDIGPAVAFCPDNIAADEHGDRNAAGGVLGDTAGNLGIELRDGRFERRELCLGRRG
jgi:hypothetical protein